MDDLGFVPDQASFSGAGATGGMDASSVPHGTMGPDLGFVADPEPSKYESTSEQVKTGLEGLAKGVAGPAATYAETKLLGVDPEDIKGREEANPWTHGISEAVGFGGSAITGTGEAALLAKAGDFAAHAAGLGEATGVAQKLARGAVTTATEMGLFQSGDELSKALLNAPQTPGSVAANIGLSALLGGVTGPAFTGLGLAAKKTLDSSFMKDFLDRLSFRKASLDPQEMARSEADQAVQSFHDMNSEISGATGLKSQAMEKLLPKEVTPQINKQVQGIMDQSQRTIDEMMNKDVPERLITKVRGDTNKFLETVTDPAASASQHFDALNEYKKTLQDYSKGNWGPFSIPSHHEAYDFINMTKSLSRDVRLALEDSNVWGGAADLQKQLNSSWTKALPAMKDFEKKFMVDVGGEKQISTDKFNTYFRQGLKNTTTTDRQKMMGNFIDAMSKHFETVDDIYQSAKVPNPHQPVGMSMLKESIDKPSLGSRVADLWHDKLGAHAIGDTAGAVVGGKLGGAIGHGLEGVYLGKEILGPVFSSVLKPILEKYPNIDIGAIQQAIGVVKSIEKGNSNLSKAAQAVVAGGKTFPSHIIPSTHDLEDLSEKTKNSDMASLSNVSGNVGFYMPGHDTSIAQTSGDAVSYINSKRPMEAKALPLDQPHKISKLEKSQFDRTLQIAQQPLMVFKHIQAGTLIPQDVQTLRTIYPAYYDKMSQELMSSVASSLQEGKKIPYHVKQSMSLFLGQNMDSTLLPASIISAQAVFSAQNMMKPSQPGVKASGNKDKLSKVASSHMTADQSAIERRNQT